MTSKLTFSFCLAVILTACSSENTKVADPVPIDSIKTVQADTSSEKLVSIFSGLELFIDSMKNENYLIDTNRLKQVIWYRMVNYPKTIDKGHVVILVPFPVDEYQKHFSDPKTYFFAKWKEQEKTFRDGNDYLLMTWTIDSTGIMKEKEIYNSLHGCMGNLPCYIFRNNNTVYAMAHRLTVHASETRKLTENLRNYIDTACFLYRPFNGREPR